MLLDFQNSPLPESRNCDVLIVGAGAVGLTLAVDLVRRGAEVMLLEAGGAGVAKDSQQFFEAAGYQGYPLEGLHVGRLRALGGTTNAWPGQLVPFDPVVFEHRPWVADQGWPLDRLALDPFYKKAFSVLGLRRDKTDPEVWRLLKTDMPNLGTDLDLFLTRWTPEPKFAVLFRDEIARHPKLHVVLNAPVTGVALSPDGRTVQHATIQRPDGFRQTVSARHVVLANGTVEITRLLSLPLSSGCPAPWSGNPWLGRGFVDHVDAYAGAVSLIDSQRFHALFDNILLQGHKYTPKIKLSEVAQRRERLVGVAVQFMFNSRYKQDLDQLKIPVKALLRGQIDRGVLAIPKRMLPVARIAAPMAARYLRHRRSYNPVDGGIQLRLSAEQIPLKTSRLRLRADRDSLGMPRVDVEWRIDGVELESMARFCEMVSDFFLRQGLARVEINPRLLARSRSFLSEIDDGNHQMGMARMSASPASGVVDSNLRVHGSNNLYVAGAATFPTTGFANPTLTAIALGLRLGEHLMTGGSVN